jgi:hypothetical protein
MINFDIKKTGFTIREYIGPEAKGQSYIALLCFGLLDLWWHRQRGGYGKVVGNKGLSMEQKYLIKNLNSNLYWSKDDNLWTGHIGEATLFNNPEGIYEVGRLLVENECISYLIPCEKEIYAPSSGPNSGFIIIVDCDGDPQEVFSDKTSYDIVFQTIHGLDKESSYHPHSAWKWGLGGFSQVFERIGIDEKRKEK